MKITPALVQDAAGNQPGQSLVMDLPGTNGGECQPIMNVMVSAVYDVRRYRVQQVVARGCGIHQDEPVRVKSMRTLAARAYCRGRSGKRKNVPLWSSSNSSNSSSANLGKGHFPSNSTVEFCCQLRQSKLVLTHDEVRDTEYDAHWVPKGGGAGVGGLGYRPWTG